MPKLDHDTIDLILIAVTMGCIVFQTIMLSAMFFGVRKGCLLYTSHPTT